MHQDLQDPTGNEGRTALAAAEAEDARAAVDEAAAPEFNEGSEKITHITFLRTTGFGRAYIEVHFSDRAVEQLRHRYVRHSPDGLEFGFSGSGAAETALNVLSMFVPIEEAERIPTHYQDFKFRFIVSIDKHAGGELKADDVRAWVRERRARGDEPEGRRQS